MHPRERGMDLNRAAISCVSQRWKVLVSSARYSFGVAITVRLQCFQKDDRIGFRDEHINVAVGAHPGLRIGFGGGGALDQHYGDGQALRDLAEGDKLMMHERLIRGNSQSGAADCVGQSIGELPAFLQGAPAEEGEQALPPRPCDELGLGKPDFAAPPEREVVVE